MEDICKEILHLCVYKDCMLLYFFKGFLKIDVVESEVVG